MGIEIPQGIITTATVVKDNNAVSLIDRFNNQSIALVARVDPVRNLALLIPFETLPPFHVVVGGTPGQGDPVTIFGLNGYNESVRSGNAALPPGSDSLLPYVQKKTADYDYDGDAIFNLRGELVGVISHAGQIPEQKAPAAFANSIQDFLSGKPSGTAPVLPSSQAAGFVTGPYQVGASDIALKASDLGPGWSPFIAPSSDQTHAVTVLSFRDAVGVTAAAYVLPDITVAQNQPALATFSSGAGTPSTLPWQEVPPPTMGDKSWAWISNRDNIRYARVEVTQRNVRIIVSIQGRSTDGWENISNASMIAQIMLARLPEN